MKHLFLTLSALMMCASAISQPLGHWETDKNGLPAFSYDAPLPYSYTFEDGTNVNVDDNPWFLLGNYRISVFTHVDGEYELISGERSWARLNQGEKYDSGINSSTLTVGKKNYQLVGKGSLAEDPAVCSRVFGCGYATWTYNIDGFEIERTMRVLPSTSIKDGDAAALVTVKITNKSKGRTTLRYEESVLANYYQTQYQRYGGCPVDFVRKLSVDGNVVRADFEGNSEDPLNIPPREAVSTIDAYAPSLYVVGEGASSDEDGTLSAGGKFTLNKGESASFEAVIGFMMDATIEKIDAVCQRQKTGSAAEWLEVLPQFPQESDKALSQELVWHAYTLEAMATYSEYYGETKIPQGTIYDYYWGQHASARDNFQHGLAPVYYNPQLAASILRYMAMRTTDWGEIRLIEYGNGYSDPSFYSTSDQQLFFFQMLAEYIRVNKDFDFFDTVVNLYPKASEATMLDVADKCFDYLRNFVGTGSHGLVRLLNSDWNDNVFALNSVRYNDVIFSGESHMNSAMVLPIFDNLTDALDAYDGPQKAKAERLSKGMKIYRQKMYANFMNDLGDRSFPRRMYFNGNAVGENDMWLEPQGYLLQAKDFSVERKQALYAEMQSRLYKGEELGARLQENPQSEGRGLEKGSRENGGFWWSMNGPVVCGVATFDKAEASRLLKKMSFGHFAEAFPEFWTSYWSASDNQESSLMGQLQGLPDQSLDYWEIPIYCAHPHAWILYCWYKIHE